jgi:hypothetical protein
MDMPTEWRIQYDIRRLEALANKEMYYFPTQQDDEDNHGYCVECERNMYSCECRD